MVQTPSHSPSSAVHVRLYCACPVTMTTSISTLVKILATITGIYCALMVGEGQRATQTLNSSRYHYPLC